MPAVHSSQSSALWQKTVNTYRRIFSIHEIENDSVLQWCFGFLLMAMFYNLKVWSFSLNSTRFAFNHHAGTCWPFFQSCAKWVFLDLPPFSYSQFIFYDILFVLMGSSAFCIYRKNWVAAHFLLVLPYLARLYIILISAGYFANFWLYVSYFGFIFLFLPYKKFFGQLQVVMCYYLSTSSKLSDAWMLGR